ncbi:hypothetical protein MJD09_17990 [bacterium]|nr:hypothetical protein [bacterium]
MALGLLAFLAGQVGLYYLIVHPSQEVKQALKVKLDRVQDTHLQLQSTDMNGLLKMLEAEVRYVQEKRKRVLGNPLKKEQIPFLVSKLEREAEAAGLRVASNLERNEKQKSLQSALIGLSFAGSFAKVMKFLDRLESREDALLIRDFSIESRNFESDEVSGQMRFMRLIATN